MPDFHIHQIDDFVDMSIPWLEQRPTIGVQDISCDDCVNLADTQVDRMPL